MNNATRAQSSLTPHLEDEVNRALSAFSASASRATAPSSGGVAHGSLVLRSVLAQALADNAEALGTAELDHTVQMTLYDQVAEAVITSALNNDAYLTQLAEEAVQLRERVYQMISTEVAASEERDSVIGISMA